MFPSRKSRLLTWGRGSISSSNGEPPGYSNLKSSGKECSGMERDAWRDIALVTFVAVLGAGSLLPEKSSAVQAATVMAPAFEVDLTWPKPLPNHWILGASIGVSSDSKDHIWIIHRPGSLEQNEVH